ncbi:hypothetical protein KP803_20890 [Vibrio sp. ZSDE26]|uniref:Uncharacterized protein n=1 Tax=Vibrio amylolyticus TaxID=2847292 RepID=A0A9X1XUA8_9VIBR|nr:hypothetical protein [Vibrio amylolyticus]MCK6265719.1 hypothetical protein [Vibrio amylolyticus]
MSYLYIEFDDSMNVFVSHEGNERQITANWEPQYQYYLHTSRKFIVKLLNDWVDKSTPIGYVISCSGRKLNEIGFPHGDDHRICVRGLISGDTEKLTIAITPWTNKNDYSVEYNIKTKSYSSLHGSVR